MPVLHPWKPLVADACCLMLVACCRWSCHNPTERCSLHCLAASERLCVPHRSRHWCDYRCAAVYSWCCCYHWLLGLIWLAPNFQCSKSAPVMSIAGGSLIKLVYFRKDEHEHQQHTSSAGAAHDGSSTGSVQQLSAGRSARGGEQASGPCISAWPMPINHP
jgi:hypothetical protein